MSKRGSYNSVVLRWGAVPVLIVLASGAFAQTPQPFPRPAQKPAQPPPAGVTPPPPVAPASAAAPRTDGGPSEAELGAPIYPSAVYLTSYEAGRGQRFYIFGANVAFAELVNYYRTVLKQKGDVLFEAPPTHQFETARYRDETMAFPPSVTIKDFSYGGSAGYPHPRKDASPDRFPTVIQIVAPPR